MNPAPSASPPPASSASPLPAAPPRPTAAVLMGVFKGLVPLGGSTAETQENPVIGPDPFAGQAFSTTGNILEDFLESVLVFPIETRRAVTLIRELDAKSTVDAAQLALAEKESLDALRRPPPPAPTVPATRKRARAEEGSESSSTLPDKTSLSLKVDSIRKRLRQKLEDKTSVAAQLIELTDRHIARLSRDLKKMEEVLRMAGDLNDIIVHPSTTAAALASMPLLPPASPSTAPPTPMPHPNHPAGQHPPAQQHYLEKLFTPGALVAGSRAHAVMDPQLGATPHLAEESTDLWILLRVVHVIKEKDMVLVADADKPEMRFALRPVHLIALPGGANDFADGEDLAQARARLNVRGTKQIYAVYPETTSFYAGVLVQAPYVGNETLSMNLVGKLCCTVVFKDDEDELGNPQKKIVRARLVFDAKLVHNAAKNG